MSTTAAAVADGLYQFNDDDDDDNDNQNNGNMKFVFYPLSISLTVLFFFFLLFQLELDTYIFHSNRMMMTIFISSHMRRAISLSLFPTSPPTLWCIFLFVENKIYGHISRFSSFENAKILEEKKPIGMKKKYEIFCFSAKKNVKIYNPCLKVETNKMKKKTLSRKQWWWWWPKMTAI